jgi:hypothetical protein
VPTNSRQSAANKKASWLGKTSGTTPDHQA